MESKTYQDLMKFAINVVKEAAFKIPEIRAIMDVSTKTNKNDLVTTVDKEIENFIASKLNERVPYPLLGEEGHSLTDFSGYTWFLDPIDGTMNFVETKKNYAISLALYKDSKPILAAVYDVEADEMYSAIKGEGAWLNNERIGQVDREKSYVDSIILTDIKEIRSMPRLLACILESRGHRRYGSAALECIDVACGRAGAFVHLYVSPWDIAGAKIICEECGIIFTRLDGTQINISEKGSALVAGPRIHEELLLKLIVNP